MVEDCFMITLNKIQGWKRLLRRLCLFNFFTFRGKIIVGKFEFSFPEEIEEILWMEQEAAEKQLLLPYKLKKMIKIVHLISFEERCKIPLSLTV